ncbi:hypothetical protein WG66_014897 [Moniliophthora roreri]|nr:hypothetical protein WG66_014897 [Moniliophthora roreri]
MYGNLDEAGSCIDSWKLMPSFNAVQSMAYHRAFDVIRDISHVAYSQGDLHWSLHPIMSALRGEFPSCQD